MTRIRVLLMTCLVAACGIAWGANAPPTIPAGARVGIVNMVTNDVIHYHVGKSETTNFMRTYRSSWVAADLFDDPLIAALNGAGFQPVVLRPSPALVEDKDSWFIKKPRDEKLPRGAMKELGRFLTEQNLGALILVAPGANTEPEFDARQRMSRLPRETRGFGFSTSDEADGIAKPLVFDFTQMIVVALTEDGAQLVVRDWGGSRLYDWPGFDPGGNIKALTDAQLEPLRALYADVVKRRIESRVMSKLKP